MSEGSRKIGQETVGGRAADGRMGFSLMTDIVEGERKVVAQFQFGDGGGFSVLSPDEAEEIGKAYITAAADCRLAAENEAENARLDEGSGL